MADRTLLDIVQDISNELEYDEINSIEDTEEALQLARVVKSCYETFVDNIELPCEEVDYQLVAIGNTGTQDNQFNLPENFSSINYMMYLTSEGKYVIIDYIDKLVFLENYSNTYSNSLNKVTSNINNIDYNIRNDIDPTVYTVIVDASTGNDIILFDAFDSTIMTTGVPSQNTLVGVSIRPEFLLQDTFSFPFLDENQLNILITEAKSRAFHLYDQSTNVNAERDSRRARVKSQYSKRRVTSTKSIKYNTSGRRRR